MNYHGTEEIYIYAPHHSDPDRLEGGSAKRMWTYLTDDAERPRLLAKFGDRYLPVHQRAGRKFIITGDAPAPQPQPQPLPQPRPETVEAAVAEIVARGKEAKPALAMRLDAAGELVLNGRVLLEGDEARIGPYIMTTDTCTCADFQHRGGWCKHRLAVRMARHLVANGFTLPQPPAPVKCPQISARNLALIASGAVIDQAIRERVAYSQSVHGARTAALRMLANGANTIPADLAQRAGMGGQTARENGDG